MRNALGDKADAEFIRNWHLLMRKRYPSIESAPDGFKYLGEGCYRTAYLDEGTNVVYKVENRYGDDYGQSNREEYLNLRSMMLRKLPTNIRFPEYHLWELDGRTVAAMEYLPRLLDSFPQYGEEGQSYWGARRELCRTFPALWDSHGANIAVDENTKQIVPIDVGGYYRNGEPDDWY